MWFYVRPLLPSLPGLSHNPQDIVFHIDNHSDKVITWTFLISVFGITILSTYTLVCNLELLFLIFYWSFQTKSSVQRFLLPSLEWPPSLPAALCCSCRRQRTWNCQTPLKRLKRGTGLPEVWRRLSSMSRGKGRNRRIWLKRRAITEAARTFWRDWGGELGLPEAWRRLSSMSRWKGRNVRIWLKQGRIDKECLIVINGIKF